MQGLGFLGKGGLKPQPPEQGPDTVGVGVNTAILLLKP